MSKAIEQPIQEQQQQNACESCGRSEEGLPMSEHYDEGDPSVGYGPQTLIYCDECWEQITRTRRANR